MKKIYETPNLYIERFSSNEFVALCGVKFRCNAEPGYSGRLWEDTNDSGELDEGDICLNPAPGPKYQSCGGFHIISRDSLFTNGFFSYSDSLDPNVAADEDEYLAPVLIWKDNSDLTNKTYHASSALRPQTKIYGNS